MKFICLQEYRNSVVNPPGIHFPASAISTHGQSCFTYIHPQPPEYFEAIIYNYMYVIMYLYRVKLLITHVTTILQGHC